MGGIRMMFSMITIMVLVSGSAWAIDAKILEAAEQGEAQAQYNLGVMYAHGRGVPQDYAEAVKWFRLAAEQEVADAQYNLGVMYEEGWGVDRDLYEAMKWYRLALYQGKKQYAEKNLKRVSIRLGIPNESIFWSNNKSLSLRFINEPTANAYVKLSNIISNISLSKISQYKLDVKEGNPGRSNIGGTINGFSVLGDQDEKLYSIMKLGSVRSKRDVNYSFFELESVRSKRDELFSFEYCDFISGDVPDFIKTELDNLSSTYGFTPGAEYGPEFLKWLTIDVLQTAMRQKDDNQASGTWALYTIKAFRSLIENKRHDVLDEFYNLFFQHMEAERLRGQNDPLIKPSKNMEGYKQEVGTIITINDSVLQIEDDGNIRTKTFMDEPTARAALVNTAITIAFHEEKYQPFYNKQWQPEEAKNNIYSLRGFLFIEKPSDSSDISIVEQKRGKFVFLPHQFVSGELSSKLKTVLHEMGKEHDMLNMTRHIVGGSDYSSDFLAWFVIDVAQPLFELTGDAVHPTDIAIKCLSYLEDTNDMETLNELYTLFFEHLKAQGK